MGRLKDWGQNFQLLWKESLKKWLLQLMEFFPTVSDVGCTDLTYWTCFYSICDWPCIINVGKVILKNQLDATITIYWSQRSAQHVSGNLLPIFRRVRLRFLQHMVQCPVVVVGRGSESGNVARCRSPNLCLPQQQDTAPICCKNLSLTLLKMGKGLPETCRTDLWDQ